MSNLIMLCLLIGVSLLSVILIACMVVLLLKRKKERAAPPGNVARPGPASNTQLNDADMRTFALLNSEVSHSGEMPHSEDVRPVSGGWQAGADAGSSKTMALFGDMPAPTPRRDESKTMMLFQNPQMAEEHHGAGQLQAYVTYSTPKGVFSYNMKSSFAIIGRDTNNNDIVIEDDKQMGRMHGILLVRAGKLFYLDMNSKNGSYIKDSFGGKDYRKIEGLVELPAQSFLRLANTSLQIEMSPKISRV